MSSRGASKNLGGRPATGKGQQVVVRMHDPLLTALDAFAAEHNGEIGRPEAVRRALAEHLKAKGYLPNENAEAIPDAAQSAVMAARYVDADPEEGVMVTGVGPMTLRRAVRKHPDWREHHGLSLVSIFRGADKEPGMFDVADLGRLAELERFR